MFSLRARLNTVNLVLCVLFFMLKRDDPHSSKISGCEQRTKY
jgi:hypothetical protein